MHHLCQAQRFFLSSSCQEKTSLKTRIAVAQKNHNQFLLVDSFGESNDSDPQAGGHESCREGRESGERPSQPVAYPLLPSRPAEQPTERPTKSKEAWLHRELDWQVQVSCHDVTGGIHRCTMHIYTLGICIWCVDIHTYICCNVFNMCFLYRRWYACICMWYQEVVCTSIYQRQYLYLVFDITGNTSCRLYDNW